MKFIANRFFHGCCHLSIIAITPTNYTDLASNVRAVNGSSADATAGVLLDGCIPVLTRLENDMWASQLLTLLAETSVNITFDFTNTLGYMGLQRVDVAMFNCLEWGLSVQSIHFLAGMSSSSEKSLVAVFNLDTELYSCQALVVICVLLMISFVNPVLTLQFDASS